MLLWTVVGVNWLASCQECHKGVFWACYWSSYTPRSLFPNLENKLIGYVNNSTWIPVVPSIGIRVTVAESLSRDLVKVSEWCDPWGMRLNTSKAMIVSRSRTMHPQSPSPTIGRTVLKESDDLVIFGVTFDFKMTFEKHLHCVSRAATERLGEEIPESIPW